MTELIKKRKNFSFGVIGGGKLGLNLTIELLKMGRLEWILAHSKRTYDKVLARIINRFLIRGSIQEVEKLPNMIIIATPDSEIKKVADSLAVHFGKSLKGNYVVHCSGVLKRDVLKSCEDLGASTAAIHPFQTFYYEEDGILSDIRWGVEATDEDYTLFASFVDLLFGFPVRLTEENIREKTLYHAVATSASNYMTTIIQLANQIADSANIDSNEFLPPIAKTTLGNNLRGLTDNKTIPLTGPIARADVDTIRLHIEALKQHPHILKPYCYMGLATVEMAHNAGMLSKKALDEMTELFKSGV